MASGEFWSDVAVSLGSILEGVAIGSVAGVLVGVAMGRVREIDWFLSTYIRALYALPLIALVPIVILWVGYQPAARLVIVIISVFLPVAVTTADGTRAITKDFLDVGQMFGARTHNVWFGIALPSALPHIVDRHRARLCARHHQCHRGRGAGERARHGHVGVHQVERAQRERLAGLCAVPRAFSRSACAR